MVHQDSWRWRSASTTGRAFRTRWVRSARVLDKVSKAELSKQQTVAALATSDTIKSRMEECASVPCHPPCSSSGLVCDVGSVVVGCNGSRGAVQVCGVGGAVGGVGVGDVVVEVLLAGDESHCLHPHYHFTLSLLLNLPPLSSPLLS
eukprot:2735661-Rhodomonas_salina.2